MILSLPQMGLLWGIVTCVFGGIIIIFPRLLHFLVGAYLIIFGLLAVAGAIIQ
jgi:hypothetical protein